MHEQQPHRPEEAAPAPELMGDPAHLTSTEQPAAVTQDDPRPMTFDLSPTAEEGMVTLVAVFEDLSKAQACQQDLERRGLEVGLLGRRGDGPEQGLRPGNVITGPGYGLAAPNQSPPRDRPMGAGVAVGATIGATAGFLAATYLLPPFGAAFATTSLVSTLAGAGLGSFVGGLTEYGVAEHDDDASLYAGQVRHGGVLLVVQVIGSEADQIRRLLGIWSPLEIRVQ